MTTDLAELVRLAVRAEVEPLRLALERLAPPPMTPLQAELLAALALVLGDAAFTSCEAIELSRMPLGHRPRLAAAMAALGTTDAHKLGMVLSVIVKRSALEPLRLVRAGGEAGSHLWRVER